VALLLAARQEQAQRPPARAARAQPVFLRSTSRRSSGRTSYQRLRLLRKMGKPPFEALLFAARQKQAQRPAQPAPAGAARAQPVFLRSTSRRSSGKSVPRHERSRCSWGKAWRFLLVRFSYINCKVL